MSTPTTQTRKILLGFIIVVVICIVVAGIGTPSCSAPEMYSDKIDAGTSYTDYDYWSLYGWRASPPWRYPQQTINTPYDLIMKDCSQWCNQVQDPADCLRMCHYKSLKAGGFHPSAAQLTTPEGNLQPLAPPRPISMQTRFEREGFGFAPSHNSPAQTQIDSETAPFCFYR